VKNDPLGNKVDVRHPWNQHTLPQPQKRDFDKKYSWVMSPRWFDGKDHLALDTGGGALARLWSIALAGLVDIDTIKATGNSIVMNFPRTALKPEKTFEWKVPKWSNTIERDRARTYFQAYAPRARCTSSRRRSPRCARATRRPWEPFKVPNEGIGCGFTEAVRGVLSHHLVIRAARSPTITRTRPRRGTRTRATFTARPGRTRTPCRVSRSSRRARATSSRASTSCGRSAASIRACRAAST
jgi:hydrogenase large subunit